jgi:phosphoribosylformimino-5-aminoimidazole carboxamide ribotide isomerase
MRVIPVLDLMRKRIVHAFAGRRTSYQPLSGSCLCNTAAPIAVATAFRDRLGATEVYLADLDAIAGRPCDVDTIRTLVSTGLHPWVDAGVRNPDDVRHVRDAGASVVIAGLETLDSPETLADMVEVVGDKTICFSLDLRAGLPITTGQAWAGLDAIRVAHVAVDVGIRSMIVLDLTRVGVDAGPGTLELCAALHRQCPDVTLYAGGGVRSVDDLERLQRVGVTGALVGTALHDGRIGADDIATLTVDRPDQDAVHS